MFSVPPIGMSDDIEEFSDVEDQMNDNDLRCELHIASLFISLRLLIVNRVILKRRL